MHHGLTRKSARKTLEYPKGRELTSPVKGLSPTVTIVEKKEELVVKCLPHHLIAGFRGKKYKLLYLKNEHSGLTN